MSQELPHGSLAPSCVSSEHKGKILRGKSHRRVLLPVREATEKEKERFFRVAKPTTQRQSLQNFRVSTLTPYREPTQAPTMSNSPLLDIILLPVVHTPSERSTTTRQIRTIGAESQSSYQSPAATHGLEMHAFLHEMKFVARWPTLASLPKLFTHPFLHQDSLAFFGLTMALDRHI
ncbi:uncharacterized protein SPSK_05619 [Sporothrix schenckii 1099-18]|uniref:Uncharacterized protein n=1 Tax=Sporothrix schenckii 1099-18 TaxID=1397361 RepID=A0A0F2LWY0_SPOSC|nr:uncharacterized protein SPSK_05619 [Sporothrix schenckii 1099-18]KJR80421.1 hypothetical protein SPSK_05619 [Sporothrix schenckii 1099-18]